MDELTRSSTTPSLDSSPPGCQRPAAGPAARERIRTWLVARIRPRSDQLFRDLDQQARQRGWTMETGPYGLSRSYADPRFDTLRSRTGSPPAGAGNSPEPGQRPAEQQVSVSHD